MVLFHDDIGHRSQKVRIVIAEKGITCNLEVLSKDDLPKEILEINPDCHLPLLVDREHNSDKAAALSHCDQASMLFPWNELDRQVSISGTVEKASQEESDRYFAARPRASQIAAWTSQQSQSIENRAALEQQFHDTLARFEGGDVPRPPHWGGYRLKPSRIEFWQGGSDRLHDRFVYALEESHSDEADWSLSRLQP